LARIISLIISLLVLAIGISTSPAAAAVVFSGSTPIPGNPGGALKAEATFTISGNTLTITLSNTATDDNNPGNQDDSGLTLSGVFFELTGNPTLTPVSATIPAGTLVQAGTCNPGPCGPGTTNVGGEFRFSTSVDYDGSVPATFGNRGISSSGYIGGAGNFNGPNLDHPPSGAVNGINFGIISNDPSFNPNGGLANDPLIKNQVAFVLTGVSGLTEADISKVFFAYGTSVENSFPGTNGTNKVSAPASIALLGTGLIALAAGRRLPGRRERH
jgi:hypothetical protein